LAKAEKTGDPELIRQCCADDERRRDMHKRHDLFGTDHRVRF
jgi:hypothetical protein